LIHEKCLVFCRHSKEASGSAPEQLDQTKKITKNGKMGETQLVAVKAALKTLKFLLMFLALTREIGQRGP
jgi:hypothetical protein